jgi:DNA-binding transcriptional LysR family regulator
MDVHVRDLRYFVAVATELHFTRAAEQLYVSQPALSKQIRMLERSLGTALLERDKREVRLTSAGRALLPHARRVIEAWDTARTDLEEMTRAQQAALVVGMSTSPGRGGLLAAIRSRFSLEHPEVTITLRQVGWADPTAGLADGTSDVAFVWLPLPQSRRYCWMVVVEEPCAVAMTEHHRLAHRSSVDFDELADEPFLALPESAGPLRDFWLAVDRRHGRPPIIGAEITNTDETYEALVDGRGICLLAMGNAPSVTRGGVITRPVNGLPPCQLALAWRRDQHNPLAAAYIRYTRMVTSRRT